MKFYLDFEATQYSERIISIGCVSENGSTFSKLVNPGVDEKITPFITKLTGITQAELDEAQFADAVFSEFAAWVYACCYWAEDPHPVFYVYGKNDATFLDRTIKHMNCPESICFATSVKAMLIDYSKDVARHFKMNQVGLNRVYQLLLEEEHIQKHSAIEDAHMLRFVQEHLGDVPEGKPENLPPANNGKVKSDTNKKRYTEEEIALFLEWNKSKADKVNAETHCTEEEAVVYCIGTRNEQEFVKYFKSYFDAALYSIKYGKSVPTAARLMKSDRVHGAECGIRDCVKANINGERNRAFSKVYWFAKEEV